LVTRVGDGVQYNHEEICHPWLGGGPEVELPGRELGDVLGSVFVTATRANALDIDDGYRLVKGHPGAVVNPVAMVFSTQQQGTIGDLFRAMWIGYEVGMRAGRVFHAEYQDYHCSGSWGALTAAAVASYLLNLTPDQIDGALGIAEYHAPVGLMMRCIESPTMVKDGIGWGAMTGAAAALLAQEGFTGIRHLLDPQVTLSYRGRQAYENLPPWEEHLIHQVYIKQYACCRWAQPAVATTLHERLNTSVDHLDNIESITVGTFAEATALNTVEPVTTEQAQYSLPWAVASAWLYGDVGVSQVGPSALDNDRTRQPAAKVRMVQCPEYDTVFPGKTCAHIRIRWPHGQEVLSAVYEAPGEPGASSSRWAEVEAKFHRTTTPVVGEAAAAIARLIHDIDMHASVTELWSRLNLLVPSMAV
jgi:2-methylcitrate dehydratase PrpD